MPPSSASDTNFTGSVPELYDTHLVPLIFEPYAADLARRAATRAPGAVLEVAAGSGVVTRAVAPVLAPGARFVVTDLNPPMLERARSRQPAAERLEWTPADALDLPFPDASFDLVLCQFGAMFFPDRVRGYAEARRVLRPGGAFIFNMWDRIEENDFAAVVTEAVSELFPQDPPLFLARTPHGHHDQDTYRRELGAAGFPQVEVEALDAVSLAETPAAAAFAYCQGTPLRGEIEARDAARLGEATERAAALIAERFGPGPVAGRIRAYVITATT